MKKHYLSIATTIKTIFPEDILDWFLWHKFIGVDHFYILDDGSEPPVEEILDPYKDDITFFELEKIKEHKLHKPILKDIFDKYSGETSWMAFIDDDEYIFPLAGRPIKDFLRSIEHRDGLRLRWRLFGPEGRLRPVEQGISYTNATIGKTVMLDHYRTFIDACQVKTMVNCENVEYINPEQDPERGGDGCDQHLLIRENVVNAFGEEEPTVDSSKRKGITTLIPPNPGARHPSEYDGNLRWPCEPHTYPPPFTIHHYAYKSFEHIRYRLFGRGGAIQRSDTMKNLTERALLDLVKLSKHSSIFYPGSSVNIFHFKKHKELREGYLEFLKKDGLP